MAFERSGGIQVQNCPLDIARKDEASEPTREPDDLDIYFIEAKHLFLSNNKLYLYLYKDT